MQIHYIRPTIVCLTLTTIKEKSNETKLTFLCFSFLYDVLDFLVRLLSPLSQQTAMEKQAIEDAKQDVETHINKPMWFAIGLSDAGVWAPWSLSV